MKIRSVEKDFAKCSEPGCGRKLHARDLCLTHYRALRRNENAQLARLYRALHQREYEEECTLLPHSYGVHETCSQCNAPHQARGLCAHHYRAAKRREDTRLAAAYRREVLLIEDEVTRG